MIAILKFLNHSWIIRPLIYYFFIPDERAPLGPTASSVYESGLSSVGIIEEAQMRSAVTGLEKKGLWNTISIINLTCLFFLQFNKYYMLLIKSIFHYRLIAYSSRSQTHYPQTSGKLRFIKKYNTIDLFFKCRPHDLTLNLIEFEFVS